MRFCKEFNIDLLDKIEGRIDQYKGISNIANKDKLIKRINNIMK